VEHTVDNIRSLFATNMTEEDTFKALQRASVPEMLGHYDDWGFNRGKFETLESLCNRYGWTWDEFCTAGALWREKNTQKTTLSEP